jgi:hypothetical protein
VTDKNLRPERKPASLPRLRAKATAIPRF